jgi:two-component system, NarL family, response regulator NreC
MSVKVFLADDHPIVRQGLRRMLEMEPDFQVIAESGNGLETLQMVEQLKPDVLIVDLMMPGLNGLEVTRQVTQRVPRIRVIILSMHQDDAYVLQALRCGAIGYVLKDSSPNELAEAIRNVNQGRRFLSEKLSSRLIDSMVRNAEEESQIDAYEQLTDREREVLQLILEGNTAAEIAKRLSISPRTAEAHRANLLHKLGITNQVDLFRYAVKKGILPLD